MRVVRRARAPRRLLAERRRRGVRRLRGRLVPARRGGARVPGGRAGPPAGRGAGRARARPAAGRPRARGDAGAPRARRGCAPRARRQSLARWHGGRHAVVYDFAEGSRDMRDLLGGKGANVAEMTRVLGAERVPAGFTITTEACVAYMRAGARARRARRAGRRGAGAPGGAGRQARSATPTTRCSSRCARGARESMPGMLDTVLNLGLNDESVEGLARDDRQRALRLGLLPALRADVRQRRAAASPASAIEDAIKAREERRRRERGHRARRRRTCGSSTRRFKELYRRRPARTSRRTRRSSCARRSAPCSTPGSGERAVEYRRINRIPDDWGTAVNVQQMVFGNKGDTLGLRRGVHPRRDHRRARAVAATSCRTPRARTWCPACARRATSTR